MLFFARCRSFLARHRSVYWLAVVAVTAWLAAMAVAQQRGLDAARRSWGESVTVWVASSALAPGDPLVIHERVVPAAALPDGAITSDPGAGVALRAVGRNEILTADDVGATATALVGAKSRVVAVRADGATVSVVVGDHVDVVALGQTVAIDGVVVAVGVAAVSVAVDERFAAVTATASHEGAAVLVLRPT